MPCFFTNYYYESYYVFNLSLLSFMLNNIHLHLYIPDYNMYLPMYWQSKNRLILFIGMGLLLYVYIVNSPVYNFNTKMLFVKKYDSLYNFDLLLTIYLPLIPKYKF